MNARKFTYGYIPVNSMKIEEMYHYERPLDERKVREIVKYYNESLVNQIVLSLRDGTYYVIDGQHTAEATRRVKGESAKLNSKVFYGLTVFEEAEMFYEYNTNKKALSTGDKLNALVISKDPEAERYINLMQMHHFPFVYNIAKNGPNVFSAHVSGQRALKMFGEKAFCSALDVMRETSAVTRYQGRCLEGLTMLFAKSDIDIDFAKLVNAINETGAITLDGLLNDQVKIARGRTSARNACAIVFGKIYNAKKRNKKIDLQKIGG